MKIKAISVQTDTVTYGVPLTPNERAGDYSVEEIEELVNLIQLHTHLKLTSTLASIDRNPPPEPEQIAPRDRQINLDRDYDA